MYKSMKEEYIENGPPQGDYHPPAAVPMAGYPPPGATLVYPLPQANPQDGYAQPGAIPMAGYPPPGDTTEGLFFPPGAPAQGGYPAPAASPPGYPPKPKFQPGPPDETPIVTQPTYGPGGDLGEDGIVKGLDFNEKSIRRAFVRKVYCILSSQLLVTLGFVALFVFCEPAKRWVAMHCETLIVACVLSMACVIAMACFESVRRKSPMNFIFLGVFTVIEGYMLGTLSSFFDTDVVMMAVGLTAVICLALTLFALQTRFDFTVMGGWLFCILVMLITFGIIMSFMPYNKVMNLVYTTMGAMLFALYLVFDTQMMMGGGHKYTISPEEYIFAALNLYLDVINLFLYILRIVASLR